jgi:hypothetical protein
MTKNNNILVVGKPKSSKTTYFAQFYLRILRKKSSVKLWRAPQNIKPIEDAIKRLSVGEEVQSTPADSNEELILPIQIEDKQLELVCPDYGGEQVNNIIELMEFDEKWKARVVNSDNWILFFRPGTIINYYDLSNAGYAQLEKKRTEKDLQSPLSDQCQLIELLQALLYIKEQGIKNRINTPTLLIALTCWDELNTKQNPAEYLHNTVPLLYEFISTNWHDQAFKVFGLSAQEFPLLEQTAKDKYLDELPENFGYVIKPDGNRTKDLTILVKEVIS